MVERRLTETPWAIVALFAVLAGGLGVSGWIYNRHETAEFRQEAQDNLSAIAKLNADLIAQWRAERLRDAEAIRANGWVTRGVAALLRGPASPAAEQEFVAWLEAMRLQYDFGSVALFDTSGNVRYRVGSGQTRASGIVAESLAEVVRTGKPALSDFHRRRSTGAIHLSILVPLLSREPVGERVVGVLSFRVEPRRFLYPAIQSWPDTSLTAETMLIGRDGDMAVYLSDLRHRTDAALSLQTPLSDTGAVAAQAALGREGPAEGLDYRGVRVLAVIARVPGSPWFVVAKIDEQEVYARVRQRVLWFVLQIGGLILTVGVALLLVFERQRAAFLRRQHQDALEREALVGHFDRLARHANDVILLLDQQGGMVEANERAVEAYGYSHEELLRLGLRDLLAPGATPDVETAIGRSKTRDGFRFETVHQRRDGRAFPVEVSMRLIDVEGASFHQGIIRDVSERKRAEAQIARLNHLYATLSEVNQSIVRIGDRGRLLAEVCNKVVTVGTFEAAWISLVDEATHDARPVAASGVALDALAGFSLSAARDPAKEGAVGAAIREDRLAVSTDLGQPALTAGPAGGPNCRSAAAVPLRVGGRVIGAFALAATDPRAFEGTELDLVEELGSDVSFALGVLEKEDRRRRAEEALRESEARLRRMIETTQEGVLIVDEDARITYANRRVAEMLRCGEMELTGKRLFDCVHETSRAAALQSFERRKLGGRESFDVRFVRNDGTACWGMVSATPIVDSKGRFEGSFSMISDITERKRAEEALAESERRYRTLAEATFEGIALSEADVLVDVNEQLAAMVGSSRRALRGNPLMDLVAPEHRAALGEAVRAAKTDTREYSMLRSDGTGFPVEIRIRGARHERGLRLVAVRDLTERKRAEAELDRAGKQLIQAQKMEAIGRLAGGIAHDFNNLLMVILSYSELALRHVGTQSRAGEGLIGIRSVVEQAKALTQQILAFSRRQVLTVRTLDPNTEIAAAAKMLRRVLGEDVKIQTLLAPDVGKIRGDASQIQQVLLNLAINARDAMPEGGTLTLATLLVELDAQAAASVPGTQPGRYVVLRVSDTGTGMDAATVNRLFEPFFTTKESGRGTGLGLATVYGIVKQHGGQIDVESAPGAGATFRIYLHQVADAAEGLGAGAGAVAGGSGSETLLLVEDHPLVREVTCQQLTALGYQVLSAEGPSAALELAREFAGRVDLLLTDVVMPDMNGRELHARLSAERPGLDVLYMSGRTENVLVGIDGSLEEGVHFVQKPVGIGELTRRIREILDAADRRRRSQG